ncbi:RICIN domain-containing protein [Streptomyces sp. FIT100]|uniref:RICIN domain-containing protein n=1 Tax=Streptomyces sp. FIT100 TaxID=2837956 RepID=UPI0021C9EDB9|nr:RICIN domain-containing protein [Streptomyces sp. FIT100]UUN25207.1 hypothetical protein KK483_01315 [Streptomyces sp. FIT100]
MYLWACDGGNSQQCPAMDEGGGAYRFVNRHSGKCPGAAQGAPAGTPLVQRVCDGSGRRASS